MDHEQQKGKDKKVTVFQGEELFFNRVLARNTSLGCSSRIYYYRNPEGVPFKWEMQPGTPKEPPKEDVIPPLSPPPALLSLGLPKPNIPIEPPKDSIRPWIKFWKKIKKYQHGKKLILGRQESRGSDDNVIRQSNNKCQSFELYGSDGEFVSPRISISSSSSSSFSSTIDRSSQSSSSQNSSRSLMNMPFTCSPWNISSVMIKVVKKAS